MNITEKARQILTQLIDANYTLQTEQDEMESYEYTRQSQLVNSLRIDLIKEMGLENYTLMMAQGKKMFSK